MLPHFHLKPGGKTKRTLTFLCLLVTWKYELGCVFVNDQRSALTHHDTGGSCICVSVSGATRCVNFQFKDARELSVLVGGFKVIVSNWKKGKINLAVLRYY